MRQAVALRVVVMDANGPHPHVLADLWGCPSSLLADEERVRSAMLDAARRSGATVIESTFHRFEGGGITGVVAVKESHLTIHTWPELGYAAVDIFLCGDADPRRALAHLVETLGAKRAAVRHHLRGDEQAATQQQVTEHASEPRGEELSRPRAGRAERRRARAKRMRERASGEASVDASSTIRSPMMMLYGLTLVVAACSIVYELLLAQTLSALLGNTVLRYSITVGCYLGALGVGALLCDPGAGERARRLTRVEIALSALGGLAVPLFYWLDAIQRYVYLNVPVGSVWETLTPILFFAATHAIIIGIGLLSGFEVPLLLAIGEQMRPQSTNRVLGVDYFGALLGSIVFPLVLLRQLGLIATGFGVALVNAVAAFILIAWRRPARRLRVVLPCGAIVVLLVVGLAWSRSIEQYFLKKFYYVNDIEGTAALLGSQPEFPPITRYRSPYQTIDLVRQPWSEQWIYDYVSSRSDTRDYPTDVWLYLDREYQFLSGMEEIYHEWFVHAAVQGNGRAPRRVLMLGGGDGLAIREVLKYPTVERVVHVDIDPEMLRLAREHPWISSMNGHAHDDPRVELVQADAFRWLRTSTERFDAVYIDMPYARDYNLSLVYSREFYGLVRGHLEQWGFVAIDTPSGWCGEEGNLWRIYYNTLRAAGFEKVLPMVSRIDAEAPKVARALDTAVHDVKLSVPVGGGTFVPLTDAQERDYLAGVVDTEFSSNQQEFTLALPTRRTINTRWIEFGVQLDAFGPYFLPMAFSEKCPTDRDLAAVNSIARPTLPPLEILSVRFP